MRSASIPQAEFASDRAPGRRSVRWAVAAAATLLACAAPTLLVSGLSAQADPDAYLDGQDFDTSLPAIEARVWFDRGRDASFETGERVRVYYRASEDAYVAIFHIDSDGRTRMVFPTDPGQNHYIRANRDYRVLFRRSQYWFVDDEPGIGYFFIVASATPLDFSQVPYSSYDRDWDLTRVGAEVYSDPYVAMDEYVGALVPDWEYGEYGLDYVEYSVGGSHSYPRFMCYDCHGYRPYYVWNPYAYSCSTFRVVVWDDPFYYPRIRYPANRVVYVGRRPGTRPRFEFKERGTDDVGSDAVVQRRTGPQRTAQRRPTGGRVTSPSLRGSVGEPSRRVPIESAPPRGGRADQGGRVAPPTTSTRGTSPARRTTPSTRFRDSRGDAAGRADGRADGARLRGSEPNTTERRPTAAVRGRPPAASDRARPQLERRPRGGDASPARPPTTGRRPLTRSDAQGRVRVPSARSNPSAGRAQPTPRARTQTQTRTQPRTRANARGRTQSQPQARPQTRPQVRPQVRRPTTNRRPPPRASTSQPRARPSRPSGSSGGAVARPRGGSTGSQPARKPPPRRRPGGTF